MPLGKILVLALSEAKGQDLNKSYLMPWHVYIIQCSDSKLYTGITNNLKRRIKAHNSGNGCRFTKYRTPVKLRYSEDYPTKPEALRREAEIKRLERPQKLTLIGTF